MRILKQFAAVLTVLAVLTLPLGVMGCANEAPPSSGAAGGGTLDGADNNTESELGEPESGTNL